ncbi:MULTISPECIES: energy transducer TonB [unclassified Myroides]|uniref:energy transducer TonB n=1 Tax=unclassified Myroides TaxID=2642485 RepID=UPI003D2F8B76
MNVKYTKEEKTSIVITLGITLLFFLLLFFIKFMDNHTSYTSFSGGGGGGDGVAISLEGTPGDHLTTSTQPIVEEEQQQQIAKAEPVEEKEVLAYEKGEETAVVVTKKDEAKKTKPAEAKPMENVAKKTAEKKTAEKKVETTEKKATTPAKADVSNTTKDAISSFMNGGTGSGGGGTTGSGTGGLSTNGGYYGTGTGKGTGSGSGSGGGVGNGHGDGRGDGIGYSLDGRSATVKAIPKYTCNEIGTVVVEVWVDQAGNTVDARAGVKGTTNTANCLLEQAKIAALQTKWQANDKAPAKQVGKIVYQFKLN